MTTSMPLPRPHSSFASTYSHSSSSSTSESFCLSTAYTDSDSQGGHSTQPTSLNNKPTVGTQIDFTLKPDKTIYSFAWSNSGFESTDNSQPSNTPNAPTRNNNFVMSTSGSPIVSRPNPKPTVDRRTIPPTLPPPTFWTSVTHPEKFKVYIDAQGLLPHNPNPVSTPTGEQQAPPPEPLQKTYANMPAITLANTDQAKILHNCSICWINDHIFADRMLPVPFNPSLLSSDSKLWSSSHIDKPGVSTFADLPDLSDSDGIKAMEWLNHLGNSLGVLHGLVPSAPSVPGTPSAPGTTSTLSTTSTPGQQRADVNPGCGDRSFDCEGSHKPLAKGLLKRKPDIVVVDRAFRHHVHPGIRLRWPLVQAIVEITVDERRTTQQLMKTLIEKASNMFDSQLHRRYVIGLALHGKGCNMQFFFALIDRTGAISTRPAHIRDYGAMTLARIVFALTFGNDRLLGADTKITIDRFTGIPQSVVVDKHEFTIITEIFASPFLYGRGTRVYIVKDKNGNFHILKDSWILATHTGSEIDHIKRISHMAQTTEGLEARFQLLCPRFVAGENDVDDTQGPRGMLPSFDPGRIRRRIVTGPIGDPITTYRSRVECLQVLIDVADQLKFLNDKCGLVHGDISINNVIIVRFLPNILAASPISSSSSSNATVVPLPSPTAGQQLANFASSSSEISPTTTMGVLLDTEENQPVPWENLPPSTEKGFPYKLDSGGSVIDFDYSRASNTLSAKTSGTMPFMAVDLMRPSKPVEHRLSHDLESLCLVLIHIVRFTSGPVGTSVGKAKPQTYRVSQWHHEANIGVMVDLKKVDLKAISESPEEFITDYWVPIAPYITKLINVVYPGVAYLEMDSSALTNEAFKSVLIEARDYCATLSEIAPNYAAIPETSLPQKRSRPKSLLQDQGGQKHPRNAHIVPFADYKDSALSR